jgi:hypothetical protein
MCWIFQNKQNKQKRISTKYMPIYVKPKHIALFEDFNKSAFLYSFQIKTLKQKTSNVLTYSCLYNGKEIIISESELNKLSNYLNYLKCGKTLLLETKDSWLHIKKYYNKVF